MSQKIYTRKGDLGETSLFTGQRVKKNNPLMDALGNVDECNSAIGLAISLLPNDAIFDDIINQLEIIQHALFDVGAAIATPRSSATPVKIKKTRFDHEEIALLEKWIDEMTLQLPELKTFILPGGHPSGAQIHVARSVCRRAERTIIFLKDDADISQDIYIYLNRLSDYLFTVSRKINFLCNSPETFWVHNKLTSE